MSGPETRPLEQVAADVIAADVEKTALLGRALKGTGTVLVLPERTYPWWIWIGLGIGGLLVLVVGGFVFGFFGGGPIPSPSPSPSPSPTSVAIASPTASPTPSPSQSPTVAPTAPPTAIPSPSPTPLVTRSSVAFGDFTREGGVCALGDTFSSAFDFVSANGVLTLTQLDVSHVTTGTITQTGPADATFSTSAAGQTYEGTITGTSVSGTHVYTADGCNGTYSFDMRLLRPLVAPAPYNSAPGFFTFLDPSGTSRDLPIGQPARIVVAPIFEDELVIIDKLPVRVVLTVGDETPWDFLIDGDPSEECTEDGSCYADSPTFALQEWFAPGQMPVLIAYDHLGGVLAVYAPNGMP